MTLTSYHRDLRERDGLSRRIARKLPIRESTDRSTLHAHGASRTTHPFPVSDAILKCLPRDDPLRQTFLRKRWQSI